MNLRTEYLGLNVEHPFVAAPTPLSTTLDGIRRLEDGGASAIVMFSLYEEQIEDETPDPHRFMQFGTDVHAEKLSSLPQTGSYRCTPDSYVELIRKAKESTQVPIIASLNGATAGGWTRQAKFIEHAGADALELNLYRIAADPNLLGIEVEREALDIIRSVKQQVSIPLAVKICPFYSSLPNIARGFSLAGAKGVVLFNMFYEPDFDIENLELQPHLRLTTSQELRLPLHWAAILCDRISADLAISGGVHTHVDAIKAVMAGAKVAMLASEAIKNGPQCFSALAKLMSEWLEEHGYESVAEIRGAMSYLRIADPGAFLRAGYVKELHSTPTVRRG